MNDINELWQTHHDAAWPAYLGDQEGELMMLDTVIAGCVTYLLEEKGLDSQRTQMVQDSLAELEKILPDVPEHALEYFERLQRLGSFLIDEGRLE